MTVKKIIMAALAATLTLAGCTAAGASRHASGPTVAAPPVSMPVPLLVDATADCQADHYGEYTVRVWAGPSDIGQRVSLWAPDSTLPALSRATTMITHSGATSLHDWSGDNDVPARLLPWGRGRVIVEGRSLTTSDRFTATRRVTLTLDTCARKS